MRAASASVSATIVAVFSGLMARGHDLLKWSAVCLLGCGGETQAVAVQEPVGFSGATGEGVTDSEMASTDVSVEPEGPRDLGETLNFSGPLHECSPDVSTDAITVDSLLWEQGKLIVEGSHYGGCEQHAYGLCYVAQVEGSVLALSLTMLHDNGGDICQAYFGTGPLSFDVTPVLEQFQEFFAAGLWKVNVTVQEQQLEKFAPRTISASVPSWVEIDAELEAMNRCQNVGECKAIYARPCEAQFVNFEADTSELQRAIVARIAADGQAEAVACTTSCECGVLSCTADKCQVSPGTCRQSELEDEERFLCL